LYQGRLSLLNLPLS